MRIKGRTSLDPDGGHRKPEGLQNDRRFTRLSAIQDVQASQIRRTSTWILLLDTKDTWKVMSGKESMLPSVW